MMQERQGVHREVQPMLVMQVCTLLVVLRAVQYGTKGEGKPRRNARRHGSAVCQP